ncbi:putative Girdin-like 2, partial [Homarus americanus]
REMASKKEDKDVSLRNIRIDDLKNTVADYTDKLAQMARQLEERQARKALLQKTFEKKQQRCEALRAEVQALRSKKREVKEQEKLRLTRIDQANRDLKAAKAKLTAMRSEKEEVKQRISEKVRSEFEARCLSLASKFQNLELVNQ